LSSSRPTAGGAVATLEPPGQPTAKTGAELGERWWAPEGVTRVEPIAIERPDLTHEGRAFEHLLISNFDGHNLTMPPMPRILERVLKLLRDRNCNFDGVANVIGEDQVIAAAVLRMTNSPLYRGLEKITALKPAITRLGAKALQTLMMHQALRTSTFFQGRGDQQLAELVWRNSLANACIMRGLSRLTKLDSEDAFLIGLLHDIGDVIVLRLAHAEQAAGRYRIDLRMFEYLCQECHQEFGELVAEEWKLPGRQKSLISSHHTYPTPDDPLRTERLQLQLTDMINSMIGYGPAASYDLLNTAPVQDLGLAKRDDFVRLLAALPKELDETMSAL
jgi:HD-like signal output (HDOD) protein